jgi:hypothetical protein
VPVRRLRVSGDEGNVELPLIGLMGSGRLVALTGLGGMRVSAKLIWTCFFELESLNGKGLPRPSLSVSSCSCSCSCSREGDIGGSGGGLRSASSGIGYGVLVPLRGGMGLGNRGSMPSSTSEDGNSI